MVLILLIGSCGGAQPTVPAPLSGQGSTSTDDSEDPQIPNSEFEMVDGTLPSDWDPRLGAGSGAPPESTVAVGVAEGVGGTNALRLSGQPETRTWVSMYSRLIEVSPGRLIELTAQVRGEELRAAGGQFGDSNIGMKFLDGDGDFLLVGQSPVVAPAHTLLSADWSKQARAVRVPPNARHVMVFAFLSQSGTMWVDNVRLRVLPDVVWHESITTHFRFFRARPSDTLDSDAEMALAALSRATAIDTEGLVIDYHQYPSPSEKEAMTFSRWNGHSDSDSVHTIFGVDTHEIAHVLIRSDAGLGANSFLTEGAAVFLAGNWQAEPLHDAARTALRQAPELETLCSRSESFFRSVPSARSYPISGSFAKSYVARCGFAAFLKLYKDGFGTRSGPCGTDVLYLTALWVADLRAAPVSSDEH